MTTSKREVESRVDDLEEDADDGTPDNLAEAIEQVKRERRDEDDTNANDKDGGTA